MRRVWVEIGIRHTIPPRVGGHPPCGGCGLKFEAIKPYKQYIESPSLRRVWVEMEQYQRLLQRLLVTLLAEGVG